MIGCGGVTGGTFGCVSPAVQGLQCSFEAWLQQLDRLEFDHSAEQKWPLLLAI